MDKMTYAVGFCSSWHSPPAEVHSLYPDLQSAAEACARLNRFNGLDRLRSDSKFYYTKVEDWKGIPTTPRGRHHDLIWDSEHVPYLLATFPFYPQQ